MRQENKLCEHATILATRPNPLAKIDSTSFKASPFISSTFSTSFILSDNPPLPPYTSYRKASKRANRTGREGRVDSYTKSRCFAELSSLFYFFILSSRFTPSTCRSNEDSFFFKVLV